MYIDENIIFLAAQWCMVFAIISQFLSFQQNIKNHILYFHLFSALMLGVHYLLLQEILASILVLLAFIRILVACKWDNHNFIYIFLSLNILLYVFIWESINDIFALLALSFATIWSFQKQKHLFRYMFICASLSAIILNTLIFIPVAILYSSIALISNIIWYRRFIYKKIKK